MKRPEWFPDWTGETCVLVGSGPTAAQVDIEQARGLIRSIAINSSWRLAPWADALYACDYTWWEHAGGCPEFQGLKISIEMRAVRAGWGVEHVSCGRADDRINLSEPGTIGWGGNSGFGALNLAAQFGCRRILLVGFDMTTDYGSHWHGDHPEGLHNPSPANAARWRRAMDDAAGPLTERGIEVINCSAISALRNYPKMPFERALAL